MATVLLLGAHSSTLGVLSTLLDTLGFHVLTASAPGRHEHFVKLTFAIIEFCPFTLPLPQFMDQIRLLKPLPTLVIGPDLSGDQITQLLAPDHVARYLKITAPLHEKRDLLKGWLTETAHTVMTLGPLQLDTRDQMVYYGARPLVFTPTEVQLLKALMQRPGQRIDCTTLGALVTCRDIQTHLGNIRRKLDKYSAVPLLRGNPRQGYSLDARRHVRPPTNPATALRIHLRSLI